jgi:hypothetical protein
MKDTALTHLRRRGTLRYAVPAARKPGVASPGHPCDACVAPLCLGTGSCRFMAAGSAAVGRN